MKLFIISLFLLISGCSSTTGVIPMGNEKYMVSHSDNGPLASLGNLKALAYKDASKFCKSKNLSLEILKSNDVPRSLGQFPETEVQFTCVKGKN
ncbi:MAG: hypothetical protein ACSHW0_19340 [Thalassotalea sp.]